LGINPAIAARLAAVQARIDDALSEPLGEAGTSRFSSYMPGASVPLQDALLAAAKDHGLDGLEALLDRFEHLRGSNDRGALRHALIVVLTHHPAVHEFDLRLPSLDERSPWKTWPSRRE
jgi:hypothetical protein